MDDPPRQQEGQERSLRWPLLSSSILGTRPLTWCVAAAQAIARRGIWKARRRGCAGGGSEALFFLGPCCLPAWLLSSRVQMRASSLPLRVCLLTTIRDSLMHTNTAQLPQPATGQAYRRVGGALNGSIDRSRARPSVVFSSFSSSSSSSRRCPPPPPPFRWCRCLDRCSVVGLIEAEAETWCDGV